MWTVIYDCHIFFQIRVYTVKSTVVCQFRWDVKWSNILLWTTLVLHTLIYYSQNLLLVHWSSEIHEIWHISSLSCCPSVLSFMKFGHDITFTKYRPIGYIFWLINVHCFTLSEDEQPRSSLEDFFFFFFTTTTTKKKC